MVLYFLDGIIFGVIVFFIFVPILFLFCLVSAFWSNISVVCFRADTVALLYFTIDWLPYGVWISLITYISAAISSLFFLFALCFSYGGIFSLFININCSCFGDIYMAASVVCWRYPHIPSVYSMGILYFLVLHFLMHYHIFQWQVGDILVVVRGSV